MIFRLFSFMKFLRPEGIGRRGDSKTRPEGIGRRGDSKTRGGRSQVWLRKDRNCEKYLMVPNIC